MDREFLADRLALAERHVAEGEHHLARQRALIASMPEHGGQRVMATDLLRTFESTQALHIADRDRIREELSRKPAEISRNA
jgi:hypothetical protein